MPSFISAKKNYSSPSPLSFMDDIHGDEKGPEKDKTDNLFDKGGFKFQ